MENEIVIKSITSSSDTMQFMIVQNSPEPTNDDILVGKIDAKNAVCDNKDRTLPNQNVPLTDISGPPNEIFRCDVCDIEFESMGELRSHANTLHLNVPATKELPKSVPINKKKPKRLKKKKESWLSRLAEIREKLPSHDLEKNSESEGGRMWECELCQNSFNRKDHLAKHIAFVHERIRPYACDRCGHRFSQKHHVAQHIQSKHENDESLQKPLACETCGKRFARKEHVENHIKLVHEKRKPFECGVCKKKFSQKHHFLSHVSNMHGVKNDPGLIPTERELKLTMKTIEKKSHGTTEELKLSNSVRTKVKSKPVKAKVVERPSSLESEETDLEQLENESSEEYKILDTCDDDNDEGEDQEAESISIVKYNPHVCPFCDKSFKQLPQLGAHIMSAHEPPSDPDPPLSKKNKKK